MGTLSQLAHAKILEEMTFTSSTQVPNFDNVVEQYGRESRGYLDCMYYLEEVLKTSNIIYLISKYVPIFILGKINQRLL